MNCLFVHNGLRISVEKRFSMMRTNLLHCIPRSFIKFPDRSCAGRERPRDRFIFPCIRELLEGCGLSLRTPPPSPLARATHVAGAALDMVFISECVTEHFAVHQGDGCCFLSPSCCVTSGTTTSACSTCIKPSRYFSSCLRLGTKRAF